MIKSITQCLLMSAVFWAQPNSSAAPVGPYYVDAQQGADSNDGHTPQSAFRTIEKARDTIRPLLSGMNADIDIILKGGKFDLDHTLVFGPQDGGGNGHRVVYRAADGETPIISGGRRVTGWHPVPGKPYVVADVPPAAGYADYFRQLYIDGQRRPIAMGQPITGTAFFVDPRQTDGAIKAKLPDRRADGIVFPGDAIPDPLNNVTDARLFHIAIGFKIDYIPILDIQRKDGQSFVRLLQPQFQYRLNRDNGLSMNFNQKYYLMNALEVMHTPGQWYLDRAHHQIFYYPKPDEDMNKVEAVVPAVETLLSLSGTPEKPIENLDLEGITFEYGNWTWPRDHYLGGTQAEVLMVLGPAGGTDSVGYGGEVPGQILLTFAHKIGFRNNIVRHMGSGGLQCATGARDITLEGNLFYDTTAAGIIAGRWTDVIVPPDHRTRDILIANNLIADTGDDYFPATGISLMNTFAVTIRHNRVMDTAYMGIHERRADDDVSPHGPPPIGQTTINYNECINTTSKGPEWKVGDSGAIYSFGPWPGTVISHNYVHDINSMMSYYNDDHSYETTWTYNVAEDKAFHWPRALYPDKTQDMILASHNYARVPVGEKGGVYTTATFNEDGPPHIYPKGTPWPPEAQQIIDQAGLDAAHQALIVKYEQLIK